MTSTPISTITRPTTRTAYCATAMAELGPLTSSPESSPGASPEASCQLDRLSFLPFLSASGSSAPALVSPTIDHAAPPPAGVVTWGSRGEGIGSGGGGATGSIGAGVHTCSAGAGVYGGSGAGGGTLGGGGTVGPISQTCSEGGGGGGGATAGPAAGGPQVAVGIAVLPSMPGAMNSCAGAPAPSGCLPLGVSVRWRAARTLRSICCRLDEYIDFVCTDLWRITKN